MKRLNFYLKPRIAVIFLTLIYFYPILTMAQTTGNNLAQVKSQLLKLANEYKGQGDPDFSKQKKLEVLVQRLLTIAPQAPLSERLPLLYGPWYQVWGAYDYRSKDSRLVDPDLDPNYCYQVISSKGYYYNISVSRKKSKNGKLRVGLLRGEYQLDKSRPNRISVHFTKYPGADVSENKKNELWKLADLAEKNELPNSLSIVPTFVVKLFFSGGELQEIYTDSDLRISYGSRGDDSKNQLFIMVKAK